MGCSARESPSVAVSAPVGGASCLELCEPLLERLLAEPPVAPKLHMRNAPRPRLCPHPVFRDTETLGDLIHSEQAIHALQAAERHAPAIGIDSAAAPQLSARAAASRPRGKRARARAGRWRALLSSKSRSLNVYCRLLGRREGCGSVTDTPRAFPTDAEAGARGITGATGRNSEACPELAASSLGLDDWPRCGRLN